ncbi:MAG TPA: ankyrin repeat domain-containing protein [Candidatus Limnocylindrales bacterium]|nr:ankyrin repeat domain-containing protein [Candidatus Limnocylindrales bacterium]
MDAEQLPARPSLEQFRKQAKDLLKDRTSTQSVQRIKKFHPRLRNRSDFEVAEAKFSLADAQWVIAQEHAFESWPKFVKHIQEITRAGSPVSKFELAADAIASGDLSTLKKLLRDNPELVRARSTRAHRAPLIHYVAANGIENFRQKTPKNILEITEALLRAGAEVDTTGPSYSGGSTALGLAATSYHPAKAGVQLELLDLLLKAGASLDGAPGGWGPLVAALHNGRGDAAAFLAERGASLDLEGAAGTGEVDAMARYVNEDATLKNGASRQQLDYGFCWACEYGHTNAVKFLFDRGFQPDWNFMHGQTGLHWACLGGYADIVELLLKANAPINEKDRIHGVTPLGWAVYGWENPAPEFKNRHHHEVVGLLVRAGAIVDRRWIESPDGGSPLGAKLRADPRMRAALGLQK